MMDKLIIAVVGLVVGWLLGKLIYDDVKHNKTDYESDKWVSHAEIVPDSKRIRQMLESIRCQNEEIEQMNDE